MGYFDSIKAPPAPTPTGNNVVQLRPAQGDTAYGRRALTSEASEVASAPAGTRNDSLNRAWFRMARLIPHELTVETTRNTLADAARQAGLPEDEIATVLRDDSTSALTNGANNPRIPTPMEEIPTLTVIEDLPPEAETDFWSERELIQHLHDFARSRRVSPWAVLGVTLARVVAATPFTVALPPIVGGKASLNLFVGLVGPSGSGKGAAEAVAADALNVGDLDVHTTGSGEGIAHGYRKREKGEVVWHDERHAVLFSVSEIDTLAAQGDRKGATLMPELRRAWSGEQLGFGYADPAKRLPVPAHEYRMCLVAGIQPARAAALLDDADGGTPQRFLWMPATDRDAPDTPPVEPTGRTWTPPRPDRTFVTAGGSKMDVCQTARDTITINRLARLRGEGEALDGHLLLAQLKVAAALALMDQRHDVNDDDWRLASLVIRKSSSVRTSIEAALKAKANAANTARADAEATRAVHVSEKLEDATARRAGAAIVRRLRREGDWLGRAEVRRSVQARDRGMFDDSIERLLAAGQIEQDDAGGHGLVAKFRMIGDQS